MYWIFCSLRVRIVQTACSKNEGLSSSEEGVAGRQMGGGGGMSLLGEGTTLWRGGDSTAVTGEAAEEVPCSTDAQLSFHARNKPAHLETVMEMCRCGLSFSGSQRGISWAPIWHFFFYKSKAKTLMKLIERGISEQSVLIGSKPDGTEEEHHFTFSQHFSM